MLRVPEPESGPTPKLPQKIHFRVYASLYSTIFIVHYAIKIMYCIITVTNLYQI